MPRKLTLEFIKGEFEKEGYTLLEDAYVNANTKMRYRCPKGHEHSMTWGKWGFGRRCAYCAGNVKLDIYYIKESFEKRGFTLLTKKYTNSTHKLKYKCPVGHLGKVKYNKWKSLGRRCRKCHDISIIGYGNPAWLGGKSFEPYCHQWTDEEYKDDIKSRDGYKCQNPECFGISDRLVIHHIDYNKKNCSPWNLITVCNSCNGRANKNRKHHTMFYNKIMEENGYGISADR